MYISHGDSRKKFTLYPPARYIHEFKDTFWLDYDSSDQETQPISLIHHHTQSTREGELQDFLNNLDTMPNFDMFCQIFSLDFQENFDSQPSSLALVASSCTLETETTFVEMSLGKCLHINSDLDSSQQE